MSQSYKLEKTSLPKKGLLSKLSDQALLSKLDPDTRHIAESLCQCRVDQVSKVETALEKFVLYGKSTHGITSIQLYYLAVLCSFVKHHLKDSDPEIETTFTNILECMSATERNRLIEMRSGDKLSERQKM